MSNSRLFLAFIAIAAIFSACKSTEQKRKRITVDYPETRKTDTVDNYFGTEVPDPYRWLEDDNSKETEAWVMAQNKVTFGYLEQIPYRDKIEKRLEQLWDYERYSTPFRKGKYYFFYKNDGMQDQAVLYIQEGLDGEPRVLLDPNKFSEDGTVALSSVSIDKNAEHLAYSIAESGSDWNEIFVMNIESGKKLDDHIEWVKFSGISWHEDGFYYSRYDEPEEGKAYSGANKYHKLYYHQLGTSQSDDKLVMQDTENPKRNFNAWVNEEQTMLAIYESESTSGNALYFKDLTSENSELIQIVEGFDNDYGVIDYIEGKLLLRTNDDAPNYRLIMVDPQNPAKENWQDLIAEGKSVLQGVTLAGGKLVAKYLKDASSLLAIYSIEGKLEKKIELPTMGSVGAFNGKMEDNIAFYSFTSFTYPTTIYKYDFMKNQSEVYKQPQVDFNAAQYETKQVFYKSKDGTEVPMFITHKKGLEPDGKNPTLLYGYGGFNISITPGFKPDRLVMLENGGVYAVANLRGGGEYGETWHKAGTKLHKQNVFDDFIAAAEYLIDNQYTSSKKLAIQGRSNGGLLVGAAITQRPELFEVALPAVGVMDMLRFHKFTIGWAWTSDYGSSEDSTQFKALYEYSPLHNIEKGVEYPATLVTTADHDDRVVPAHSFKFIATLQEKHAGENPVLIRIDVKAGHGAGKPVSKQIEEEADIWAFTFWNLGVEPEENVTEGK